MRPLSRSGIRSKFREPGISKSGDSSGEFLQRASAEYRLKRKGKTRKTPKLGTTVTETAVDQGVRVWGMQDGGRARSLDIGLLPAIRFACTVLVINIHELRDAATSSAMSRLREALLLILHY